MAKKKAKQEETPVEPTMPEQANPIEESAGKDPLAAQERDFPTGFVTVTKGDHKGRYGVLVEVRNNEKGEPHTALVRTRDADHALLSVEYASLAPAESGAR